MMHTEEPFTIVVGAGSRPNVTFHLCSHLTDRVSERVIDREFYERWTHNHRVPRGQHTEFEIVDPKPWDGEIPQHVHVHIVPKTGRVFVCWVGALRTTQEADAMVEEWCIGTVYTLVTGQNFVDEKNRDPATFLDRMRSEHGIALIE